MKLDLSQLNKQQRKAVTFKDDALMVIAGAGCITGDSIINFNRGKKGFTISIRDAYKHFNQKAVNSSHNWDLNLPTFVRSFQGYLIKLHRIKGIVKSGRRVVYKLTLENGRTLKATSDHKIMTNEGFIQLGNLRKKKHLVMCDGHKARKKEGKKIKRRDKVIRSLNYHPFGYKDKAEKVRVEEYRLIYEAKLNGFELKDFIKLLRQETIPLPLRHDLKFINSKKFDIHHIDGDWTNNEIDNLVILTKEDHKKTHKKEQYKCFNQGVPEYVKIKSIKEIGDKMTYDIQCEAPFHNFVANGIVIHNSGKTRVLTYRIAHLLKRGYRPSRIMATTFTTKAAEEMRERLEPIVGETKADRLRIGTFHSLSLRILKDLSEHNGKYEHPRTLMPGARFMTMLGIINRYKYGKPTWEHRFATKDIIGILNQISYWKNEGLRVKDVEEQLKKEKIKLINEKTEIEHEWSFTLEGTWLQAYKDYEEENKKSNRIDFDDMLLKTFHRLQFKKNKKFLDRLRNKIDHILVDESQDLNKIQFLLVKLFAGKNRRITMVADDYQVLYGFRGASVNEIIDFGKYYNMTVIKLEQNYRSTKHIVEYGNKLIKHNKVQMWKNLFTENEQGVPAHVSVSENVDEEAQKILEKVQELIYSGYELNDVAILYRTNAQSRAIVDEFIINHVPHKVYSREGFYDRKEVKDMLAYLKIVCDPHSTNADDYRRIINRPSRFLGKKFIDDVENLMFDEDYESYWLALQSSWKIDLGQRQRTTVQKFIDQLSRMAKKCETTEMTSRETLEMIIEETGYLKWMNKKDEESGENEPDNDNEMNLDSLLAGANRFSSPTDFLMFVESQEFEKNEEEDAIHVMTIHKSKGMEFPFVFIIGLCTPVMPHYKSNNPEEERRIAYVAITRAKEELYLSTINGKFNRMNAKPSPFIDEMGAKFPSWYSGQVIGVDKALKSSSKPMVTKYDVRGNIVSIKEIKKIDSVMYAIADKHSLIDERTGEIVENENPLDTES